VRSQCSCPWALRKATPACPCSPRFSAGHATRSLFSPPPASSWSAERSIVPPGGADVMPKPLRSATAAVPQGASTSADSGSRLERERPGCGRVPGERGSRPRPRGASRPPRAEARSAWRPHPRVRQRRGRHDGPQAAFAAGPLWHPNGGRPRMIEPQGMSVRPDERMPAIGTRVDVQRTSDGGGDVYQSAIVVGHLRDPSLGSVIELRLSNSQRVQRVWPTPTIRVSPAA
jgi:hypothetical protein